MKPEPESVNEAAISRIRRVAIILEAICPGISEALTTLVRDAADDKKTKPCCPCGNPFCDDVWLPIHPDCGCKPTMAQISVMTYYATKAK